MRLKENIVVAKEESKFSKAFCNFLSLLFPFYTGLLNYSNIE